MLPVEPLVLPLLVLPMVLPLLPLLVLPVVLPLLLGLLLMLPLLPVVPLVPLRSLVLLPLIPPLPLVLPVVLPLVPLEPPLVPCAIAPGAATSASAAPAPMSVKSFFRVSRFIFRPPVLVIEMTQRAASCVPWAPGLMTREDAPNASAAGSPHRTSYPVVMTGRYGTERAHHCRMEESKTAVVAALVGNAALAVLKGTAAAATGSAAMLAETFHSIADTGNEVLLLVGMRAARRPPDAIHPFGHGKNVYFWSFVVAMLLFTLGGAFSVWEAVRHWLHPVERTPTLWAYGVLAGGFVFESISLAVAVHGIRRAAGSRSLREYWQENRDPTLITVLFEDSAALLSLVIAGAGLWLYERTGQGAWDAVASAAIGVLLLTVAIVLAIESYSLLLGERAPARVEQAIRDAAAAAPEVTGVAELHTMNVGPRRVLVVLGVRLAPTLSEPEIADAVERLEQQIVHRLDGLTDRRLVVIEPVPEATPATPTHR